MRELTPYQQGLWERFKAANSAHDLCRAQFNELRSRLAETQADLDLYTKALKREGLQPEQLVAEEEEEALSVTQSLFQPADKFSTQSNGSNSTQSNGFNKTHAVILTFQKHGQKGLGPTELWRYTMEEYPKATIGRNYVNTLMGKLKDRGLIEKTTDGTAYVLTEAGKNYKVRVEG